MNSNKKVLLIVLTVILVIAIVCGTIYWYNFFGRPVAVVNGEKVTMKDFRDFLKYSNIDLAKIEKDKQFKKALLETLATTVALKQEAIKQGLKLEKSESKIKEMMELVNKLYEKQTKNITASDTEVKEYYNRNKNLFCEVDVYKMLIDSSEVLKVVEELLGRGYKPEEVARRYSKIIHVGKQRYDRSPVMRLLVNRYYSVPIREGDKYAIYWVKDKKIFPLESVEKEIKKMIEQQKKVEKINSIVEKVRKKAKISILL